MLMCTCISRELIARRWWVCCQERSWDLKAFSSWSLCLRSTHQGCGSKNTQTRTARSHLFLLLYLTLTFKLLTCLCLFYLKACMLVFYPNFEVTSTSTSDEVVLLLDASESMRGESLSTAQRIALHILKTLDRNLRVNVIFFGTGEFDLFLQVNLIQMKDCSLVYEYHDCSLL